MLCFSYDSLESISRSISMSMLKIYAVCMLAVLAAGAGLVRAEDKPDHDSEEDTGGIIQSVLKDRSFKTGLTTRGMTGLILTAQPECLLEKGQFLGFRLFSSRLEYMNETTSDIGAAVSWAYGFGRELPIKMFKHIEFSATIPVIMRDESDDTSAGLGDALCSAKVQILEEDTLRPAVPAVGFSASLILPTGSSEFERTDRFGMEAGVMVGKTLMDSMGLTSFKVYGELSGSFIEKDDETDFVLRGNAGMAFPFGMYEDWLVIVEYQNISRSDVNEEDGHVYLLGMQYMEEKFNATLGFVTQYIDDIDEYERKIILMYDMKF